jgi:hypothetical protein
VSHLTERKEKDCLNCGAVVDGRFCHVCGQENIEPKESFWHLLTHFVYDVTHFDGKFFSTLKYLLFRPGFLSHEYLRGRRASYLHPIRMYVFTSAFFFLIFFSANKDAGVMKSTGKERTAAQQMKRLEDKRKGLKETLADTFELDIARIPLEKTLVKVDSDIARLQRDTMYKTRLVTIRDDQSGVGNILGSSVNDSLYKTAASYDSVQRKLPKAEQDGFIIKRFKRQRYHLNEKYNGDQKAIGKAVIEKFNHLVPQMLFVSLPLFALMLQLLYFRKKSFFYVNHVVFTIHLYCGTFIIILAGMLVDYLLKLAGYAAQWDNLIFALANFFFWYKSLRKFYHQRRAKTILKYLIVLFLSLILMTLIFIIFFIFSAMTI